MIPVILAAFLGADTTASQTIGESPRVIAGDEAWLVDGEVDRRGLAGQRYFEFFDMHLQGLESVCPPDVVQQARAVADAASSAGADGTEVMIVVDGSEDVHEFDAATAALLGRRGGVGRTDLPQLFHGLRVLRAQARAECVRQALWSAGVTTTVTLGPPRVKQAQGRRGAVVFVLTRDSQDPPHGPGLLAMRGEPNELDVVDKVQVRKPAPAEPSETSPLNRPLSRGRFGFELQAGYLAAERTHFWASGGWFTTSLVFSSVPLGRARVRFGIGYFYSDGATEVQAVGQALPEFVRQHAGVLGFEVTPHSRVALGLRTHLGHIREILQPDTPQAVQRGLFAFAAGPGVALRLFRSSHWEGYLGYDFMLVAGPRDVDRGLGRVHLVGLSVAFLPFVLPSMPRRAPRRSSPRRLRG